MADELCGHADSYLAGSVESGSTQYKLAVKVPSQDGAYIRYIRNVNTGSNHHFYFELRHSNNSNQGNLECVTKLFTAAYTDPTMVTAWLTVAGPTTAEIACQQTPDFDGFCAGGLAAVRGRPAAGQASSCQHSLGFAWLRLPTGPADGVVIATVKSHLNGVAQLRLADQRFEKGKEVISFGLTHTAEQVVDAPTHVFGFFHIQGGGSEVVVRLRDGARGRERQVERVRESALDEAARKTLAALRGYGPPRRAS